MQNFRSPQSAQQGVVLVEAMLAIVIFSIGVLAVVGLQAAMIKNTDEAKYRAEASYIAQKRVGEIWADPNPDPPNKYDEEDTKIPESLPGGIRTTKLIATGKYQVTVKWKRPGPDSAERVFTTTVFINEN
jgi:type IV pilus assembly protein PilV